MGRFIYGGIVTEEFDLEDRLLAHLELAISTKFRRGEPFAFSLMSEHLPSGKGHRVFWMHPTICVQFDFDGDWHRIGINRAWVRELVIAASTEWGLRILPEPAGADSD